MGIFEAIILGLVQGLTEFLPISSSGHLSLAEGIMGVRLENATFEIFLHFGTFLSICVVLRKNILGIVRSIAVIPVKIFKPAQLIEFCKTDNGVRQIFVIVFASIPAGFIGVVWGDIFEGMFSNPKLVSLMLLFTGLILMSTARSPEGKAAVTAGRGFIIGLAQALAIIPGISRSGSTIIMALHLGIAKDEAVEFSFLLALPVILGATILKSTVILMDRGASVDPITIILGTTAAFFSGCAAIILLLKLVRRGKLHRFAYYCFFVGISGLIYFTYYH